jgi:hypothetical protein
VYREWYGAKGANVGIKLTAEEVARGIEERTPPFEKINDSVIDPAAFAMNGGPSIAERMMRECKRLQFRHGDNKRIPGWDQLRDRLKGQDAPMIYFFATCQHAIRTLPSLQHDDTNAEDVDSDGEDHAGDALRYLCMARPWVRNPPESAVGPWAGWRLDDLWKQHEDDSRWRR